MKTSSNKITAFLIALALSFGFGTCCLKLPALSGLISSFGNINMLSYALTVVFFCLAYLIAALILDRSSRELLSPRGALTLSLFLLLGNSIFLAAAYVLEVNIYGGVSYRYIWHSLPAALVFLFIGAEVLFFFLCLRQSRLCIPPSALFLLYGALTLLMLYTFYTPEVFMRDEAERYHMNAYFNSVYNVLHGQPYTEYTTSIYGHYGLLYRLPLLLLGGDLIDFVRLNAVLGALCFLAMFLALHFMVKSSLLRLMGALAMTFPVLAMRSGTYWQLWPHRILFMSLTLCFGAFCVRFHKLNRITCVLGYVLGFLAILWNTESGLFCTVAWSAFWILRLLCGRQASLFRSVRGILCHLAGIVLSFLSAWGVVEVYNLSAGGRVMGIREFLFPLLQSSYMDDSLRVDLPDYPSAYITVLALLFLGTAWGISRMRCFRARQNHSAEADLLPCYVFFVSVLSLGQITYFMNRAAYHNLDICHLPAMLLLCIFAERGLSIVREFRFRQAGAYAPSRIFHGAFAAAALAVLLIVNTGNMLMAGVNAQLRLPFHQEQEVVDFAAHVAASVPKDTYAFGISVQELYAALRWDTNCYTLDFPDIGLRPEAGNYLMDDLTAKGVPGFLARDNALERLEKYCDKEKLAEIMDTYQLKETFEFKEAVFYYYVKK